jgi:hypothetical protein
VAPHIEAGCAHQFSAIEQAFMSIALNWWVGVSADSGPEDGYRRNRHCTET